MKSKKTMLMLVALAFSHAVLAANVPERCPDIRVVQAAGINLVNQSESFGWIAYYTPSNKYKTADDWTLSISGTSLAVAESKEEAEKIAREILQQAGAPLFEKPMEMGGGIWMCRYSNTSLLDAVAVFSPPTMYPT